MPPVVNSLPKKKISIAEFSRESIGLNLQNKKAIEVEKTIRSNYSRIGSVSQQHTKEDVKPKLRLSMQSLLQKLESAKNAPKQAAPDENVEYHIGIDLIANEAVLVRPERITHSGGRP
jgi:hypothetical protein